MRRWWRRRPLMCPEVGRTLQSYLDDRVDEDWAARVERHLEHCRRCGMEAKTYRELRAALGQREMALREDTLERLRSFASELATGKGEPPSES